MTKRTRRESDTTADDVTVLRAQTGGGSRSAIETPRVLKQRFVLEEKIGSGGMGTVYRARDLRKVEARDKNPYVGVKVLNNDFRAHPDAFIALQREASKSQAIAHPNIVSIFDFDKDGDIPYMTMELLEGKELAELLKEYPNGMPDALLWPALEGMCAGLKRAHDAGIIHADFKPGNVIVSKGGVAKILDFGIARAVRTHQLEGEETVFDPAKLAALTPAYASKEMLQGKTPSTSDDVYSFAVVAYLMVTGRHPYSRTRADEAARQGLVPERPKRLTSRQWRVLERALAFERSERPATMDEVIGHLLRPSPLRPWLIGGGVLGAVVAAMALWLGPPNVERAEVARDAVASAQIERIDVLLGEPVVDSNWHNRVAEEIRALSGLESRESVAAVRERVLDRYLEQMRLADLDAAVELLGWAAAISEDGRFADGRSLLESRQQELLTDLVGRAPKDSAWIETVDALVARHARVFGGGRSLVTVREQAAGALRSAALAAIEVGDATLARSAFDDAERLAPGSADLQRIAASLAELEEKVARNAADSARLRATRALDGELARLSSGACPVLDVDRTADAAAALRRAHPTESARIDVATSEYIARCVLEVGRSDPDRALTIRDAALKRFPDARVLRSVRLDPCGMQYLVGQGTQPGRSGFCVDTLRDGSAGPRLVVVPVAGVRLAVGKVEVSWTRLAPFCAATGRCEPRDSDLPVTGVEVEVAGAFARWLSAETGRVYRLPTVAEWRVFAAAGAPDPNRNCRVSAAGVIRGVAPVSVGTGAENPFGLVNLLGNVREWVRAEDGWLAAGGSFEDDLAVCAADTLAVHDGSADVRTGFRLVREVP